MPPAKTFFSYCRSDESFALRLAQDLRQAGIPIWFDQLDIPAGRRWDSEIQKALGTADSLLVILSPASVASENVMDEVSYALDHNKHVIPVLYQQSDVPLRIRRLQYIDFTSNYEAGLTHLLRVLRQTNPENGGSFESVSPAASGKTDNKTGIRSNQSTTAPSNGLIRKPLLYGVGAVVLALLAFLVFQEIARSQKSNANKEVTASDTTTNSDVAAEQSLSLNGYTLFFSGGVDTVTAKSVLEKMSSYRNADNETLLKTFNYELAFENGCYKFYPIVTKDLDLPGHMMATITELGQQLHSDSFSQNCLIVGVWDYDKEKLRDSTQFDKVATEE